MKINYCVMIGVLVTAGAVAQNSTSTLPPVPAPASAPTPAVAPDATQLAPAETNAPAKKPAPRHHRKSTKKSAAKAAATEKQPFSETPATLVPGTANVVVSNLNVRGQAGLKGEVVSHLQKGDTVTVVGQINLDTHKADEPAQWAKITLPQGADVWVRSSFIDANNKTVLPKKLNLRAGPSEDYSVIGVVERGTVVNEVGTKGEWTKIEAPTNSFAYVAAMYLKQEASGNVPVNPAPSTETGVGQQPVPTPNPPTTVAEAPPIVNQAPPTQPLPQPNNNTALLPPPTGAENTPPPAANNNSTPTIEMVTPPGPRIVTHEGYVRYSESPVAPTYYELYDPTTMNAINYLHTTSTNLDLGRYLGYDIIVSGEEGLDARWKDTPVLTVQRIHVVSTKRIVTPVLKSPRASTIH